MPRALPEEEKALCCIRASIERRDRPVGEPENWRALAVVDSSRRAPVYPVNVDDMALLANLPKVSPSQYQRWADGRELAHPARHDTERGQEPKRRVSDRPRQ